MEPCEAIDDDFQELYGDDGDAAAPPHKIEEEPLRENTAGPILQSTAQTSASSANPEVTENAKPVDGAAMKEEKQVTELGIDVPQDIMMHDDAQAGQLPADGPPEWEVDSSPYESSDDDSTESSSSDSDSADDDYELLDPVEQARRLMEDDGGSDDEGGAKATKGGHVRSHNEHVDEQVEKPDVIVTPDMAIEELGRVETVVENVALIKAKTSGEYQVLEAQSLLCLADRSVIGVVSETLGRVQEPLYCVRFSNLSSMEADGVTIGTTIFYVPGHSTFVFTKALQSVKGSDASNIHDEEVGAHEMEFSDDEAEADYKRSLKQQKQAKHGIKLNGKAVGPGMRRQEDRSDQSMVMNYDDEAPQEDLYTPLTRPANFHETPGSEMVEVPGRAFDRPQRGGRGRGDRGRGRGRGGRGGARFEQSRPQHTLPEKPNMAMPPSHATQFPLSPINGGQPGFAQAQPNAFSFQGQGQMHQHNPAYNYAQHAQPGFQYPQQQHGYGQAQNTQFWTPPAQQFYPPQPPQPLPQGAPYQFQHPAGLYGTNPSFPGGVGGSPQFFQNQNQQQQQQSPP